MEPVSWPSAVRWTSCLAPSIIGRGLSIAGGFPKTKKNGYAFVFSSAYRFCLSLGSCPVPFSKLRTFKSLNAGPIPAFLLSLVTNWLIWFLLFCSQWFRQHQPYNPYNNCRQKNSSAHRGHYPRNSPAISCGGQWLLSVGRWMNRSAAVCRSIQTTDRP